MPFMQNIVERAIARFDLNEFLSLGELQVQVNGKNVGYNTVQYVSSNLWKAFRSILSMLSQVL